MWNKNKNYLRIVYNKTFHCNFVSVIKFCSGTLIFTYRNPGTSSAGNHLGNAVLGHLKLISVCTERHLTHHIHQASGILNFNICLYRGADKSLAGPGKKQTRKNVREARDFNNIETRAVFAFFFFARQSAKGNSRHSDRNISFFPSWSGYWVISTPIVVGGRFSVVFLWSTVHKIISVYGHWRVEWKTHIKNVECDL